MNNGPDSFDHINTWTKFEAISPQHIIRSERPREKYWIRKTGPNFKEITLFMYYRGT